jgi:hypothetical protein
MASDACARLDFLRQHITQALLQQLEDSAIDWSVLERLGKPVVRIEASLEDASKAGESEGDEASQDTSASDLIVSVCTVTFRHPSSMP